MEFLIGRDVPLGGMRSMQVSRVLPQRHRTTVGSWCFADVFGPDDSGSRVNPHPHIGLQTLTWLVSGCLEHKDSIGSTSQVHPGTVSLMTAGRGILHSEASVGPAPIAGVQFWIALPEEHRKRVPDYHHVTGLPSWDGAGARLTVFAGSYAGQESPGASYWPSVGLEVRFTDSHVDLDLTPEFEHALIPLSTIEFEGHRVPAGDGWFLPAGRSALSVEAEPGTIVLVVGGKPWQEPLVMWWNLVARSHEEIVSTREDYEAGRLGRVGHDPHPQIPAPPMPNLRLRPRPPAM